MSDRLWVEGGAFEGSGAYSDWKASDSRGGSGRVFDSARIQSSVTATATATKGWNTDSTDLRISLIAPRRVQRSLRNEPGRILWEQHTSRLRSPKRPEAVPKIIVRARGVRSSHAALSNP